MSKLPVKLFHYSGKPITHLSQKINDDKRDYIYWIEKPIGFWFSVEDYRHETWVEWCLINEFNLKNLHYKYLLVLNKNANILHLSTLEEITNFELDFRKTEGPRLDGINWDKVRLEYQGIIIAPYQDVKRFSLWYYGWDCASGCIWDLSCIDRLELQDNTGIKDVLNILITD